MIANDNRAPNALNLRGLGLVSLVGAVPMMTPSAIVQQGDVAGGVVHHALRVTVRGVRASSGKSAGVTGSDRAVCQAAARAMLAMFMARGTRGSTVDILA